jgi:site-specific recombinase XerD
MRPPVNHLISDSVGTGMGTTRAMLGIVSLPGVAAVQGVRLLSRKLLPLPSRWRKFLVQLPVRLRAAGYAESTVARYTRCLRVFLFWCRRHGSGEIQTQDVIDFLAWLRRRGYGNSVRRVHLSAIRTVFDRLEGADLTSDIEYVPPPEGTAPAGPALVTGLLSQSSERDRLLVALLARVGLRVGELAALRWRQVAETGVSIRVRRGRPKRPVLLPVPHELAQQLAALRKGAPGPADHVFPGRLPGRGLSVRGIQAVVARLAHRCGTQTSCTALTASAQTCARPARRRRPARFPNATLTRTDQERVPAPRVRGPPPAVSLPPA